MLYAKNSIYPIVKATKFTAHAQYHVTCAYGVAQHHMYQFLTPTFMGLRRRLRDVYIRSSPC